MEALSRGAEHAVFNDAARESAAVVRTNVERLGFLRQSTIYSLDYRAAIQAAARAGFRFGLVFLDPSYRAGFLEETLAALKTAEVLAPGCRIIAEHAANLPPETPPGFTLCDRRKYGTAGLSIFEEERA